MNLDKLKSTFSSLVEGENCTECGMCNGKGNIPCEECNGHSKRKGKCADSECVNGCVPCPECCDKADINEDAYPDTAFTDDQINIQSSEDLISGKKLVTVCASNEFADELTDLIRLSGLGSKDNVHNHPMTDDIPCTAQNADEHNKKINIEPTILDIEDEVDSYDYPLEEIVYEAEEVRNRRYIIKVGDQYLATRASDGEQFILTSKEADAAKYYSTTAAASTAAIAKAQLGKPTKVVPLFEIAMPKSGNRDWANSPNEQIAGMLAVIDDCDGPNKAKLMHKNYRMGDNTLTVEQDREERLHENASLNTLANSLYRKFKATQSTVIKEYHSYDNPIANAIMRRIKVRYPDAIEEYGYDAVQEMAEEIGSNNLPVDEIGSSDVSIWTRQCLEALGYEL